jgi:5-hydroxyisourate hydrolase-like protein (transthyretin family)
MNDLVRHCRGILFQAVGCSVGKRLIHPLVLSVAILHVLPAWPQSGSVSGIVTDAGTKKPIAGVRVSLCDRRGAEKVSLCSPTLTGTDGRFVFARVSKGKYYLRGEALGYLEDVAVLDGSGEIEIAIQAGEQRTARLSLLPEASISGRLLDEKGQPMAGIEVAAISQASLVQVRRQLPWEGRVRPPGDTSTDKNGEFRISSLTPGGYLLRADFSVYKADDSLLRKGYLPAYYPDASTIKEAQVVCLAPGTQQRVTFAVRPRTLHEVSGKLVVPPTFSRRFEPLMGLSDESGKYLAHREDTYDRASNSFKLSLIPPGSYELGIASGIYRDDVKTSKKFTVTDANVSGLEMQMQASFNLSAEVQLPDAFHTKAPYSLQLRLAPEEVGPIEEFGIPVSRDGSVTFTDLLPGHYTLYLFTEDPVYLKSARFKEQDVIANGLSLDGSPTAKLQITIERATGKIDGKVYGAGHLPLPGADVKLITRQANVPRVVKSVMSNANGEFHLTGIAPGRYELFALDEVIRDSEVGWVDFEKLTNKPMLIEVADSTGANVELEASQLLYAGFGCGTGP